MLRLIGLSAVLVATAAVAQAPNDAPARTSNDDPNEVVCMRQKTTGSRVNDVRVCRTRAEWAAVRAETRGAVERNQQFKTTSGN